MSATLPSIAQAFFSICRLKTGPQDLPVSSVLMGFTLACYLLISILLSAISMELNKALLSGLLDLVLMLLLTTVLLILHKRSQRLPQTITAIAGTSIILSLTAMPIVIWINTARDNFNDITLPGLLMFFLIIWNIVILAHILRHALSTIMSVGIIISLIYFWLQINLINLLIHITTVN